MDPATLATVLAGLGITNIDPTKLSAALSLVEALGGQVPVDTEAVKSYFPDIEERSFYLPTNIPKNFYYDAPGLRSLTMVNSGVFRRLLGIS